MAKYVLVLFILFFSACSRLDLALSLAPRIITNELDEAFNLSSERYRKLKAVIADDIDKNKKEFFATVIEKIDYLLILTERKEFSKVETQLIFNEIKELQKRAVYIFKPSFSEALLPISTGEVEFLKKQAGAKLIKTDERLLDRQQYHKYYRKIYNRYMSFLFDESNVQQDMLFKTFLDENYDYFKFLSTIRRSFLQQFDLLFDKKTELLNFAIQYYAGEENVKSADYKKKQSIFYDNVVNLFFVLWQNATPEQKKFFRKKLFELRTELGKLIR